MSSKHLTLTAQPSKGSYPFFQFLWCRIARPSEREDAAVLGKSNPPPFEIPIDSGPVLPMESAVEDFLLEPDE